MRGAIRSHHGVADRTDAVMDATGVIDDRSVAMPAVRLTGPLWPLRPPPMPGELLSSWMARLGLAHGISWRAVTRHMNTGSTGQPADVDYILWRAIRETLALRTGRSEQEVTSLTLRRYAEHLDDGMVRRLTRMPHWITRIGRAPAARGTRRPREFFGLQYCPHCLASDSVPYFRQAWRLAWPVCAVHGVVLVDRCHVCGHAVGPRTKRTVKGGSRKLEVWDTIRYCAYCAAPRREAPSVPAAFEERALVARWLGILAEGRITLLDGSTALSHAYLGMARRIAEVLSVDEPAYDDIRRGIERAAGIRVPPQAWQTEYREIESTAIETRRSVLLAVEWLMTDWPERLLDLWLTPAGFRSLEATRDPGVEWWRRVDYRWELLGVTRKCLDTIGWPYGGDSFARMLVEPLQEGYAGIARMPSLT